MKKRITKRQWRRFRGEIIRKFPNLKSLRHTKFKPNVMTDLVFMFIHNANNRLDPHHLKFWYGDENNA